MSESFKLPTKPEDMATAPWASRGRGLPRALPPHY
jgi:hypothetical protein